MGVDTLLYTPAGITGRR